MRKQDPVPAIWIQSEFWILKTLIRMRVILTTYFTKTKPLVQINTT